MLIKIALKNIFSAGIRTWLHIFVFSLVYVAIIALQGIYNGWQEIATKQMIEWDIAEGQFWQKDYDPYDPFCFEDSHEVIPESNSNEFIPILFRPGILYPQGRMKSVIVKGVPHNQKLLKLPTEHLNSQSENLCIIGQRAAKNFELRKDDSVTLRWKNKFGAYDAIELRVEHIFATPVPSLDINTVWIDLEKMQNELSMYNEASILVFGDKSFSLNNDDWIFKNKAELLKNINDLVRTKSLSASILYSLLLFLALIAVFDSQVLSIFHRLKEIGTMMALGVDRTKITILFTLEGFLHAVLAIFLAFIIGFPSLKYLEQNGIPLPANAKNFQMAGIDDHIYPHYSLKLILSTILIVLLVTLIVSYIPTRKISKMKPTSALRGKLFTRES